MAELVNLGQIAAIHVGLTPPQNKTLIWFDQNQSVQAHKVYNFVSSHWEPISSGALYVNDRPLQIQVGAAGPGTTFNGSVAAALDKILNAVLPPGLSLSIDNPAREFGASTAATLAYTAYRSSDPLTSLVVNGTRITPTGQTQSGTLPVALTPNVHNSFNAVVSAGSLGASAGCGVDFYNRYYMFASGTDLLGASAATISAACLAAGSQALDGGGRSRSYAATFAGQYAYYAVKAAYGMPGVTADGLANNGFVSSSFALTNAFGYVETFLLVRSGEKLSGAHSITYA